MTIDDPVPEAYSICLSLSFKEQGLFCHKLYRQLPMYTCVSLKKRPVPESAASVRTSEKNAVFLSSKDGT